MSETTYQCARCEIHYPPSHYSKDSRNRMGLRHICKTCEAQYYRRHREKILAGKRDAWPEYRKQRAAYIEQKNRRYRSSNAERISTQKAEYRRRYPLKISAKNMVYAAIRSGALVRDVCEICGCPQAEAHHDDYLEPLSVRWLCREHHAQWHAENGPGKNGDLEPREIAALAQEGS